VARWDDASQSYVAVPVAVPDDAGSVVLALFGTGIRGASGVTAKVKGIPADVLFAGAQPEYVGLDQVNVRLPAGLAGSGEVDVEISADGKVANLVRVAIQ
jgi:uncharacterized protein (TIGR03437 family)